MSWLGRIVGANSEERHSADKADELLYLPVDCQFEDDETGRLMRLRFNTEIPRPAACAVRFKDDREQFIKGRDHFVDEDGDFTVWGDVEDEVCRVYVPFGALNSARAGRLNMVMAVVSQRGPGQEVYRVGQARVSMEFPAPPSWDVVEYLRPLLDLFMAVVWADSQIRGEEIHSVKEYLVREFELQPHHMNALKQAMKARPVGDLQQVVKAVLFRQPGLKAGHLLELLAGVAKSDEEAHPIEVGLIRQVGLIMGMPEEAWPGICAQLGLPEGGAFSQQEIDLGEAFQVLRIPPGASKKEIQTAYRKLVADYHPDKVANLPREFQEVAHQKMIEINAAYDALRRRGSTS